MKKLIFESWSRLKGKFNFLRMGALVLAFLILGACVIKMLPSKDTWYMQHYIIMQDFERAAYKKLSDEGKQRFQSLFWEARSPESKKEFQKRKHPPALEHRPG